MPELPFVAMHGLALHEPFIARVRMAWAYTARMVLTESPSTPGNPLRVSLARTVLNPADFDSPGLTPVIATCPIILTAAATALNTEPAALNAAVTDEQIQTAVETAWNLTAGVTPADLTPADGAT